MPKQQEAGKWITFVQETNMTEAEAKAAICRISSNHREFDAVPMTEIESEINRQVMAGKIKRVYPKTGRYVDPKFGRRVSKLISLGINTIDLLEKHALNNASRCIEELIWEKYGDKE